MRTLPSAGSESPIGASGTVRCVANHLLVNATEYAALWTPAVPPPSPSAQPSVNATLAYTPSLLSVEANPVFLSVLVILMLNIASLYGAAQLKLKHPHGLLHKKEPELPVHPTTSGVAAHAEMAAVHLHQFALHHHGEHAEHPPAAADPTAPAPSGPLALMGPKEAEASTSLPKLSARFEVEGDVATFDAKAFLRRLATLIGVEDVMDGAVLSAGSSMNTVVIDTEISCPDATTLVMTAKTLKKAPGPLGLALGVKLSESPTVTVPEPPKMATAGIGPRPVESLPSGLQRRVVGHSEPVAPTIQERIPAVGGRSNQSRRLLVEKRLEGAASGAGSAKPPPNSLGTLDWQFGMPQGRTGLAAATPSAPAPPALEGGIQERISMSGMTRPSRGPGSLRQRAAAATGRTDPLAPGATPSLVGGIGSSGGLLGKLGLSEGQAQELGARDAPATVRDGIQERLPPMPGMRRTATGRRATGEPRLRAQGSIAEALRSCPPPVPSQAEAPTAAGLAALAPSAAPDAAGQPIQERVPRMARAPAEEPATPPPSPPEVLPKASGKGKAAPPSMKAGDTSLVVKSEKVVAGAAFETRLQTNPRVLPKGAPTQPPEDVDPETWDDRSVRDILWSIVREHTFFGCVAAFLYGDSPKLASVPQAAQLLCASMMGLLLLSCAQLRYTWLGSTWTTTPPRDEEDVMERMPFLSSVGIAAALVGWPCVLIARWIFLTANRLYKQANRAHGILMYAAAWGIVWLTVGALAIGTISMSTHMDKRVLRVDVMVGWALACAVQWLLYEPAALALFASFTLLLKWCTSFEDLPEVKAVAVKQKKEQLLQKTLEMKSAAQALELKGSAQKTLEMLKGPVATKPTSKSVS